MTFSGQDPTSKMIKNWSLRLKIQCFNEAKKSAGKILFPGKNIFQIDNGYTVKVLDALGQPWKMNFAIKFRAFFSQAKKLRFFKPNRTVPISVLIDFIPSLIQARKMVFSAIQP